MCLIFSLLPFWLNDPILSCLVWKHWAAFRNWNGLGCAFFEAFILIHCLHLFRDATCPLGDQVSLPTLDWTISDLWKMEEPPLLYIASASRRDSVYNFPIYRALLLNVNHYYCHLPLCIGACNSLQVLIKTMHKGWLFLDHNVFGMAECWRHKGVNAVIYMIG